MITQELCFGQRFDKELGCIEPWYVNACVDRIKEMQLYDKVVMEWGGGRSSLWWARKAKMLYSVDHNEEWFNHTQELLKWHGLGKDKVILTYQPTHEGDQSPCRDLYVQGYFLAKPDICIVDGVHRYECAEYAVNHFKSIFSSSLPKINFFHIRAIIFLPTPSLRFFPVGV